MSTILLPIRKEHSDNIFKGIKKYEYRRNLPNAKLKRILVYESRGCGLIVGEFEVADIIKDDKSKLWQLTSEGGNINQWQFEKYYKDKKYGYAIKIGRVLRYPQGKALSEFGLSRAPQNYVWVEKS